MISLTQMPLAKKKENDSARPHHLIYSLMNKLGPSVQTISVSDIKYYGKVKEPMEINVTSIT